ncbi:TPA: hypothetical protein N0F65_012581 [Lagenidium giganteum]|uniref:Uncharacterized protein n=1 Tax=Lagenidium giganteum TaxID=4803 RepID=A0AAV2YS69_9STRA|nr:TPA: hypothetical protein N0F65_012581 [Lagenidium giganteum]
MCVLDEAVDNSDRAVMNKKGKEPVTLSDFCNYIDISNNDFASFIEESDRRSLCLETNNMMIAIDHISTDTGQH